MSCRRALATRSTTTRGRHCRRSSYDALEGDAITVIGRLAAGVSREQADAETRLFGERTAAALPATHAYLRPRVVRLGDAPDDLDIARLALRNLPALLVLSIACLSVGTLIYARTATREGEIAVRSALGASRARILSQLFVEARPQPGAVSIAERGGAPASARC